MNQIFLKRKIIFILIIFVFKPGLQQSFAQQTKTDSLISVLKTTKADTNRINVLSKLCNAIYLAEPYKAIEYANQGLTLSEKISYKKGSRNFLLLLGNTYYQVGKNDTAMMYFEKIYKTLDEKKDVKEIATISNNMGLVNLHLGKVGKALDLITKANGIYKSLNEESLFANGCTMLGSIYENQGEFTKALDNYLKALKIYENEHNEHYIGITLLHLSSVYRCMKQYDKAKDYALEAKLKLAKANDYNRVGVALYKLALIHAEEKEYDDSNYYLYEAERIFEDTHSSYYLTLVRMLLGSNLDDKGDHDSAINYYKDALVTSQQMGEIQLIAALNGNIGIVLMEKGEYFKALEYIYKSEKLLTEINDRSLLLDISPIFIEIYSHLNQPDSILKYFQRYQALSDSIFSEQNSNLIAEMQTKYETEKKENELIISTIKIEEQKSKLILLTVLFFVLLTSSLIIYFLQRKKHQKNLFLAKLNLEKNQLQEAETKCRIRNTISDKAIKVILKKLTFEVESQKCYLDPDLSINSLALKTETNREYLSQIINDTYRKNFNEFINYFRIKESILILEDIVSGKIENWTMEVVAEKSGFKYTSTFNPAFKLVMNMNPTEFKKVLKNM